MVLISETHGLFDGLNSELTPLRNRKLVSLQGLSKNYISKLTKNSGMAKYRETLKIRKDVFTESPREFAINYKVNKKPTDYLYFAHHLSEPILFPLQLIDDLEEEKSAPVDNTTVIDNTQLSAKDPLKLASEGQLREKTFHACILQFSRGNKTVQTDDPNKVAGRVIYPSKTPFISSEEDWNYVDREAIILAHRMMARQIEESQKRKCPFKLVDNDFGRVICNKPTPIPSSSSKSVLSDKKNDELLTKSQHEFVEEKTVPDVTEKIEGESKTQLSDNITKRDEDIRAQSLHKPTKRDEDIRAQSLHKSTKLDDEMNQISIRNASRQSVISKLNDDSRNLIIFNQKEWENYMKSCSTASFHSKRSEEENRSRRSNSFRQMNHQNETLVYAQQGVNRSRSSRVSLDRHVKIAKVDTGTGSGHLEMDMESRHEMIIPESPVSSRTLGTPITYEQKPDPFRDTFLKMPNFSKIFKKIKSRSGSVKSNNDQMLSSSKATMSFHSKPEVEQYKVSNSGPIRFVPSKNSVSKGSISQRDNATKNYSKNSSQVTISKMDNLSLATYNMEERNEEFDMDSSIPEDLIEEADEYSEDVRSNTLPKRNSNTGNRQRHSLKIDSPNQSHKSVTTSTKTNHSRGSNTSLSFVRRSNHFNIHSQLVPSRSLVGVLFRSGSQKRDSHTETEAAAAPAHRMARPNFYADTPFVDIKNPVKLMKRFKKYVTKSKTRSRVGKYLLHQKNRTSSAVYRESSTSD